MAQYIDKSAVVAEIEKWINGWSERLKTNPSNPSFFEGGIELGKHILSFLNTIEVKEVGEKAVSNDLEEAANDYAHDLVHDDVFETFIAGAKWQKEQDQSTIELAEDHAYFAGSENTREKLIKKACEWLKNAEWVLNNLLKRADGDDLPEIN